MNRQEFFSKLAYLLKDIPESERMDALAYYNDYFDEAGVENEQRVMQELGSPEQVAQIILDDYYRGQQSEYDAYGSPEAEQANRGQGYEKQEQQNKPAIVRKIKNMDNSKKILLIILLVFTFPIWIGILAGLFGGIVGILGALFGGIVGILGGLFGSAFGFLIGGAICFGVGVSRLFTAPVEGLVTIAVGALLLSVCVLTILLLVLLLGKWIPKLIRSFVSWIRSLRGRKEGENEI